MSLWHCRSNKETHPSVTVSDRCPCGAADQTKTHILQSQFQTNVPVALQTKQRHTSSSHSFRPMSLWQCRPNKDTHPPVTVSDRCPCGTADQTKTHTLQSQFQTDVPVALQTKQRHTSSSHSFRPMSLWHCRPNKDTHPPVTVSDRCPCGTADQIKTHILQSQFQTDDPVALQTKQRHTSSSHSFRPMSLWRCRPNKDTHPPVTVSDRCPCGAADQKRHPPVMPQPQGHQKLLCWVPTNSMDDKEDMHCPFRIRVKTARLANDLKKKNHKGLSTLIYLDEAEPFISKFLFSLYRHEATIVCKALQHHFSGSNTSYDVCE